MVTFEDIKSYERFQYVNTCFHTLFNGVPLVSRLSEFGNDRKLYQELEDFFQYGLIPKKTLQSKQRRKITAYCLQVNKYLYYCKRMSLKPKKALFIRNLDNAVRVFPNLYDYVRYLRKKCEI